MRKSTIINFSVYAALLLVLWLGLRPFFAESGGLRATIGILETKIAAEKETLDKLNSLVEEIDSKEEELKILELAILSYRDIASVLVIFEEVSLVNGLALSKIDVSDKSSSQSSQSQEKVEEVSTLGVLGISLELSGKYSSFLNFLKDIEKTFPLTDISEIEFKIQSQSQSGETTEVELDIFDPILDFNINLETYYRK